MKASSCDANEDKQTTVKEIRSISYKRDLQAFSTRTEAACVLKVK